MEIPKFEIGTVTRPQNWPIYHCSVQRILNPEDPEKTEYQRFDVWASNSARCRQNAVDLVEALNEALDRRS